MLYEDWVKTLLLQVADKDALIQAKDRELAQAQQQLRHLRQQVYSSYIHVFKF